MATSVPSKEAMASLFPYNSCSEEEHSSSDEAVEPVEAKDPCDTCLVNEFKYRCPKCLIKSCSLPCVKKHKEEKGCDGVRSTEFDANKKMLMSEMTLNTLRKDMSMLEKGINLSNSSKKKNVEERARKMHSNMSVGEQKK